MILSEKIIEERKKLGLSQEELAEKLNVSRQAVSKWESAQSIPDLQKIVAMSELFSVSTDYLLKDDQGPSDAVYSESDNDKTIRRVSIEEANSYMDMMKEQSRNVACGVLLCILAPVLLIISCALSKLTEGVITEKIAVAVGLIILFVFIAAAVFIFIRHAGKTEPFEYLQNEVFETAYGVSGLVKERKEAFKQKYIMYLSLGVILCVLSPLPLIISALFDKNDALTAFMAAMMFCIVSAGVYMIVRFSLIKKSYEVLLQEGNFTKSEKESSAAGKIYWSLITALYLLISFITKRWDITWIVWPVAGVLFAPVVMLVKLISGKKQE